MIEALKVAVQEWLELDAAAALLRELTASNVQKGERLLKLQHDVTALAAEVAKLKQPLERHTTQQDQEADPHMGRM